MEDNVRVIQNVIIESRNKLFISGVKQVISFDDETVILDSALGKMTVKGENIKIENFNNDSGDFSAQGTIHAVVYMASRDSGGGFVSRLFK